MTDQLSRSGRQLSRGGAAQASGVNPETIRYYERIGLLPAPSRSAGGHRLYGERLLRRLQFIRRSRELGFTLEEIRDLLRLADGGEDTCAAVMAMSETHLAAVRAKLADLAAIERTLSEMLTRCRGGTVPACPIIDALSAAR